MKVTSGADMTGSILAAETAGAKTAEVTKAQQQESVQKAAQFNDQEQVNTWRNARTEKEKKDLAARRVKKSVLAGEKGQKIKGVDKLNQDLDDFFRDNPELMRTRELLERLCKSIIEHPNDSKEGIKKRVFEYYKDPHQIDEALKFLEIFTRGMPELNAKVKEIIAELTTVGFAVTTDEGVEVKITPREIYSGRKMGGVSRETIVKGVEGEEKTPVELRVMYKDFIHNPRPASIQLCREILGQYKIHEQDLSKAFDFLFHAVGRDLEGEEWKDNALKDEHARLLAIMQVGKQLQDAKGPIVHFKKDQKRLNNELSQIEEFQGVQGSTNRINFLNMAEGFIDFISDRFPTAEKALQICTKLGVTSLDGKIIILSHMRDAIRAVSPRLYQSTDHRNECFNALIEALENLEDEKEEVEEQDFEDEDVTPNQFTKAPAPTLQPKIQSLQGEVQVVQQTNTTPGKPKAA